MHLDYTEINQKSAPIGKILCCFALLAGLLLQTSCSDDALTMPTLPHAFGGNEVPPEVMTEPRVVPVPPPESQANLPWLRLGDVPSKPKNFTPQPLIDASKTQMENNRAVGLAIGQQYQSNFAPSSGAKPEAEETAIGTSTPLQGNLQ